MGPSPDQPPPVPLLPQELEASVASGREEPSITPAQQVNGGALPVGAITRRTRDRRVSAPPDHELPYWCTGAGCSAVAKLREVTDRCGNDIQCWRDAVLRLKGQ